MSEGVLKLGKRVLSLPREKSLIHIAKTVANALHSSGKCNKETCPTCIHSSEYLERKAKKQAKDSVGMSRYAKQLEKFQSRITDFLAKEASMYRCPEMLAVDAYYADFSPRLNDATIPVTKEDYRHITCTLQEMLSTILGRDALLADHAAIVEGLKRLERLSSTNYDFFSEVHDVQRAFKDQTLPKVIVHLGDIVPQLCPEGQGRLYTNDPIGYYYQLHALSS